MVCKICNNSVGNTPYFVKEMMFGTEDQFKYFECANCKCIQIENIPSDLTKYYPDNYYSYNPPKSIKSSGLFKYYRNFARDRYELLGKGLIGKTLHWVAPKNRYSSLKPIVIQLNTRILDVGCGNGQMIFNLKEIGFENLLGIDPFIQQDITYENGLSILKKNIHEVDGEWDVIMFNHSFEHLENPRETLTAVSALLKNYGVCIIRIPIASSQAWETFKENWVQLDAPRHFFLHTHESMQLLTKDLNLSIEKTIWDSSAFQFWGSIQYQHEIPLFAENSYKVSPKNSMFSRKEIKKYEKKAGDLNNQGIGDSCAFYIRKNNL